jgi:hypothetical protein
VTRILLAALGLAGLAAPPAAAVDLTGTWHVLVHYKDSSGANPEAPRWEDRVWVFLPEGDRLRWIDYPIVVMQDETGRFQGRSRVLAHWTPNPGQAAELEAGPTVNSRGSKSKTLRGSEAAGWRSSNAQQRQVGFITYEETWSIEGTGGKPVFTRTDVLGGEAAAEAEGMTRYATSEVAEEGKVLRGSYDRDGIRKGTFTLRRVGNVKMLSTEGPTPNEKQAERVREEMQRQLQQGLGADEESGEEESP